MINKLPPELLNNLLLYLDIDSLLNVTRTNRYIHENCKYILENQWEQLLENENIIIKKKQKLSLEEKKIYTCVVRKLYETIKAEQYDKIYLSLVTNFAKKILSTSFSYHKETFTLIIYSPIDTFLIEKLLKQTIIKNYPIEDINCVKKLENHYIYLFRSTYHVLNDYH